ncbi:hypothetical protein M8C21_031952, partial [Ambrosia artemisiifolia]
FRRSLILDATFVVGWDGEHFYECAVVLGEVANFAAYAFAPAILVTPLGALIGCVLCLVGSTTIVLHAPHETQVSSVKQVWHFATEPVFLVYACTVLVLVGVLIYRYVPLYGHTHLMIYVGICSLMGSLTALDTFNINVVSPDWDDQSASQIATEICGFVTILCGTFLLHKTKDMGIPATSPNSGHLELQHVTVSTDSDRRT